MAHRVLEGPWKFMVKEIMEILPYFSTAYQKIADPIWAPQLRTQT